MANPENIKDYQFDNLTASKQREIAQKGGQASAKARALKKSRQGLLQTFLDGTYTDKKGNTFTGQELLDKDIAAILGNPNHKHFMKMFELMMGDKYEADVEKTKAETALVNAKTALITGEGVEIEDNDYIDSEIADYEEEAKD